MEEVTLPQESVRTRLQRATLNIVHSYAKAYGWTRNYILDHVYLDDDYIMQDVMKEDFRRETILKYNLIMMPHLNDEARENFVETLYDGQSHGNSEINLGQKTDFEAIEKAKAELEKSM